MKKLLFLLLVTASVQMTAQTNTFPNSGRAGIGTTTPDSSSLLEVKSTTSGVLLPRMTQTQRNAITSPATGLLIFQTNNNPGFYFFNGTSWVQVSNGKANTNLSNLTAKTAINNSLFPASDTAVSLGSGNLRWKDVHLKNLRFSDATEQSTAFVPYSAGTGINISGNVISSTASSSQWTNLGNDIFYQAGNVGIGEAKPQGILHVSQPFNFAGITFSGSGLNDLSVNNSGYTGTSSTTYVIRIQNAGPNPNIIEISNDGGVTFGAPVPIANPIILANRVTASFASTGGHTFGDQWIWRVNPSFNDVMVVKDGRVGIGVPSPGATLDVRGDALVNGLTAGRGQGNNQSNTVFGAVAFQNNTNGTSSTAIGHFALNSNTTGDQNTAVGSLTLMRNISGNFNTSMGMQAMESNVSGSENTGIGSFALQGNSKGLGNTAVGIFSLSNNDSGSLNVAIGRSAMLNNVSGNNNVAIGNRALRNSVNRSNLVAIGDSALFNNGLGASSTTQGRENTAVGSKALFANTTGWSNTALGFQSLFTNSSGIFNVAVGNKTLFSNTTGASNTAVGGVALQNNTSGQQNTGTGVNALMSNTTGNTNTATGANALMNNTVGSSNTAFGANALQSITVGLSNVAVGASTGNFPDSSNNCTFLGNDADQSTGNQFSNSTALGNTSRVSASNQIRFGNSSVNSIGGQVGYSTLSDGRFKTNLQFNVPGLTFIKLLQPVTYRLDVNKLAGTLNEDMRMDNNGRMTTVTPEPSTVESRMAKSQILYSGFVAQDVEKAAKSIDFDFSGIDKPKNDKDLYGLRYGEFVVPLVKAVQELNQKNEDLQKQIDELKAALLQLLAQKTPCTTSK